MSPTRRMSTGASCGPASGLLVMSSTGWLVRGTEVLASAEIAENAKERLLGLLGRDSIDGVLLIPGAASVHTIGMSFAIDVAWCDREQRVLRIRTMRPWRISRFVRGCSAIIEAEAGSFGAWGVAVGDVLVVRQSGA